MIQCHRCLKLTSSKTARAINNVHLGPFCYETVLKRCRLRGIGEDSKLIADPSNNNLIFYVSDISLRICPDPLVPCVECVYHRDKKCPLEKFVEDSNGC